MSGGSGVSLILFKLSLGFLLSHCCCSCCVRGFWCHIAVAHVVSGGSGVALMLFKLSLGVLLSHFCCSCYVWGYRCHIAVAHVVSGVLVSQCCC